MDAENITFIIGDTFKKELKGNIQPFHPFLITPITRNLIPAKAFNIRGNLANPYLLPSFIN